MESIPNVGSTEQIYPIHKVVPLVSYLATQGIAAEEALFHTNIPVSALNDPRVRISRMQLMTFFKRFLHFASPDTNVIEIGKSFELTDYGFFGYALLSSATISDAINFALKYRELATPIAGLKLDETKEEACWTIVPYTEMVSEQELCRFVLEYQTGQILALQKSVTRGEFQFSYVRFAFPEPADAPRYRRLLDCPIDFGQGITELHFSSSWLKKAPYGANKVTFQLVEEACCEMFDKIGEHRGTVGAIYRHLLNNPGRFAKLEEMAAQMNWNARTLRRKIAAEGSNYQLVVDEVRFKLASAYLRETETTIESIADRLGFSDASSFRRAFKRWSAMSPLDFRQSKQL